MRTSFHIPTASWHALSSSHPFPSLHICYWLSSSPKVKRRYFTDEMITWKLHEEASEITWTRSDSNKTLKFCYNSFMVNRILQKLIPTPLRSVKIHETSCWHPFSFEVHSNLLSRLVTLTDFSTLVKVLYIDTLKLYDSSKIYAMTRLLGYVQALHVLIVRN